MRLPKIDRKALDEKKKGNFEERLRFIELHAKWLGKGGKKRKRS